MPEAPLYWPASTTWGTLTVGPPNVPRRQPNESPRLAGSTRSVQRVSCERPPGPSPPTEEPGGASAAASAAASVIAPAAAAATALKAVPDTVYAFNSRRPRSERTPRRRGGAASRPQHVPEQRVRACLRQRLVEVAALGRLHARGAPVRARAPADQARGVRAQLLEARERRARDADA